jgi:hypothetical protein
MARRKGWAGLGPFCVGFALLVAATLLNLAHDRMTPAEVGRLPSTLANMYEMSGKGGVTFIFVSVGLAIIVVGTMMRRGEVEPETEEHRGPVIPTPYLYPTGENAPPTASAAGMMVLQTRRYLQPQRTKSGSTGNAQTTRTP